MTGCIYACMYVCIVVSFKELASARVVCNIVCASAESNP
jgi:hypothetical protein